ALRVVLVRDGRAEERHDAVAGVLVHRALEAVHALSEELEEAIEDAVPVLGIDLLGELHRALHVGEEHGHLLALTLERAAGAEDLLGEVPRGVGSRVRLACRLGCGERASAPEAEAHLGSVRPPAACARRLGAQRAAAVATERGIVRERRLADEAVHEASSRATCSARALAPVAVNSRCAARSSRWRAASSPRTRASAARATCTCGVKTRASVVSITAAASRRSASIRERAGAPLVAI